MCAHVCARAREREVEREPCSSFPILRLKQGKVLQTSMSAAESDVLFPQAESPLLADFSNLSDYEDFSTDSFLLNEFDGYALLDDLDCKGCLKPLLVSELNEFSSSLAGIKEEDEEEEEKAGSSKDGTDSPEGEHGEKLQGAIPDVDVGLCSMHIDNITSEAETLLTSNEISSMSLEDAITQPGNISVGVRKSWRASPFKHIPPIIPDISESAVTLGQVGTHYQQSNNVSVAAKSGTTHTPERSPRQRSLITAVSNGMHGEKRGPSITPSIFHINSPLSSPSSSVSTPDGNSMLKMFCHEENGSMHHGNGSIRDPATLALQDDVYHRAIPVSVMQDGSGISTMHRSRSSHALGQFRLSGHLDTCPEDFNVSSMQGLSVGYSSPNNFVHYQGACPLGLAERSPTPPMRRVFSTGDIQACNGMPICYGDNNLSRLEHVNSEENMRFKVGHYTLEERKLRLNRYRQKRHERNFSKKIKYACRKTLADSRPRIRGRFARTLDDSGEPLMKDNGVSYDDEYEEMDTMSLHCGVPHNRMVSFWDATGMNATIRRGH